MARIVITIEDEPEGKANANFNIDFYNEEEKTTGSAALILFDAARLAIQLTAARYAPSQEPAYGETKYE